MRSQTPHLLLLLQRRWTVMMILRVRNKISKTRSSSREGSPQRPSSSTPRASCAPPSPTTRTVATRLRPSVPPALLLSTLHSLRRRRGVSRTDRPRHSRPSASTGRCIRRLTSRRGLRRWQVPGLESSLQRRGRLRLWRGARRTTGERSLLLVGTPPSSSPVDSNNISSNSKSTTRSRR